MPSKRVDFINRNKGYKCQFVLNPTSLKNCTLNCALSWEKVEFNKSNKSLIPQEKGVYAFIVENNRNDLPVHGYVMYVGQAGQDSDHNLQKRYGNYLSDKENENTKRDVIHYFLNNWEDSLHFYYAVVKDKSMNLEEIERGLNDAFIPPYSTNDFSAEVRRGKNAWQR